ncbi:hypothetical protein AB0D14_19755 [Streptomyces sp. NPDC048484]|uniref:hypothetical protein n=1 Tax=Streptomyces sp. NPDC048484 TaxID=3155146 RepID=UPI0034259B27
MRFEVTHYLSGHDAPTSTLTDAAGVGALLARAETLGTRLHVRPRPRSAGSAASTIRATLPHRALFLRFPAGEAEHRTDTP